MHGEVARKDAEETETENLFSGLDRHGIARYSEVPMRVGDVESTGRSLGL